jgi:predicted RNA binding protein YcfA (HicA-like mRNA interferase family)
MGKIKELPVRKVIEVLNKFSFKFIRRGKHDVYYNAQKNITVPVPTSHGIITRGVIQSLIKQTGIPREEFFP